MPQITKKVMDLSGKYAVLIPKVLVDSGVIEKDKEYIWKWEELKPIEKPLNKAALKANREVGPFLSVDGMFEDKSFVLEAVNRFRSIFIN